MEKEANLDVHVATDFCSQHCRHHHQVIVVDPDKITLPYIPSDGLSKCSVCCLIRRPCVLTENDLARMIVDQRP